MTVIREVEEHAFVDDEWLIRTPCVDLKCKGVLVRCGMQPMKDGQNTRVLRLHAVD